MVITLDAELEAALKIAAEKQGGTAETLAMNTLRQRYLSPTLLDEPRDEWERQLRLIATDCGVSLSDEALGREEMYE